METVITVESKIYDPNINLLREYGKLQQSLSRKLFNELTHNPNQLFKDKQREYIANYQIKARLFKSIWKDVTGKIQAITSNNKNRIKHLITKKLELEKQNTYQSNNKLNKINLLLKQPLKVKAMWGGKAFYKKQWNIEDHNKWLNEWKRKRDYQIYVIGSKDETFGNSLCQLQTLTKLRLTLSGKQQYLNCQVNFDVKKPNYQYLIQAISLGKALTYRLFERDNGQWYVQISFTLNNDCPYQNKAIGIDINYNLFSTCLVKSDGNPESFIDYNVNFENLSKNQIKEELIKVTHKIINLAKEKKTNIVIEDINLKDKKNNNLGKATNRKLHLITYKKFIAILKSCAIKNGIFVKEVNPAYTSISARLKYALPLGRSTHNCAALTIGRRGLGYQEKVPSKIASLLHSGERIKHSWTQWALLSKRLKTVLEIKSLASYYKFASGSNDIWSLLTQSDGVRVQI